MGCLVAGLVFVISWGLIFAYCSNGANYGWVKAVLTALGGFIPVIPGLLAAGAYFLVDGAIQSARTAERNRRQQIAAAEQAVVRQRADESRQRRRDELTATDSVVYLSHAQGRMIRCSNNHRFMFQDFVITDKSIQRDQWSGEYYTDYYDQMGCPLCKSKIMCFEEDSSVLYRVCDRCKCAWSTTRHSSCPSCNI